LVESGQILPLLDALDEANASYREPCLKSINEFRHGDGLVPFAVSSRIEDYDRLSGDLDLSGAVLIQPLAESAIRGYLLKTDAPPGLLEGFEKDADLRELLSTPLWINVVLLACRDAPDVLLDNTMAPAELRRLILSRYVDHMFTRPKAVDIFPKLDSLGKVHQPRKERTYPRKQAEHWLCWLASSMIRLNRNPFYLEGFNNDWLPTLQQRGLAGIIALLAVGLSAGLAGGLAAGLFLGLPGSLFIGLICGLTGGFWSGVVAGIGSNAADRLHWSWKRVRSARVYLVVIVLLGMLLGGISLGLLFGLVLGLVLLATFVLTLGLRAEEIPVRASQNEGTWRSGVNAFLTCLCFGFANGLLGELIGGLRGAMASLSLGFVVGLPMELRTGGSFFVNHWSLRLTLRAYNFAPLLYVPFLNYATERLLLRRVGGGYIFIHRVLMEYFASLEPHPAETPPPTPGAESSANESCSASA